MTRRFVIAAAGSLLLGWLGLAGAKFPETGSGSLLVTRDDSGKELRIETTEQWESRRKQILQGMEKMMGPLPTPAEKGDLAFRIGPASDAGRYLRKKISYESEKGERVPAWLLVPKSPTGKKPAMLCLHQTVPIGKDEPAGLGGKESLNYAHHLAERGYVCLVPDYPSFGEYPCDFTSSRYASGSMKAIWNNIRGVDLLCSLEEVDAKRIGVIGHSLGGHNAMFTAAFEPRIRAIVSSCGFTSFPRYYGGNLKGWTSLRYMPRIQAVYGGKAEKLPVDFPEIVASFAPRAFLACAPVKDDNFEVLGVKECMARAREVYKLFGREDRLQALYPDCQHDFPAPVRQEAYAFLDRWLKDRP